MTSDLPPQLGIPSDTADNGPRGQTVGALLRRTRETRRIAISDAAATLRLKVSYVEAIEKGAYEQLPGPAYAVGFVRAYAEYLGLDGDEAARRFKREAQGFDGRPDLSLPMPIAERSIPGGRMLMTALVLAVCGYGLWYYVGSGERRHPETVARVPPPLRTDHATPSEAKAAVGDRARQSVAQPTAVAKGVGTIAAPPTGSVAPPPKVAAAPASPKPAMAPVPPGGAVAPGSQGPSPPDLSHATPSGHVYGDVAGPVRIEFRFTGDCWIAVKGGGPEAEFGKLMHAGDVYRVPDRPGLVARVGDSETMELVFDGKIVTLPKGNSLVRNINLDPKELTAWAGAPAPAVSPPPVAPANPNGAPAPANVAAPKPAAVPPDLN